MKKTAAVCAADYNDNNENNNEKIETEVSCGKKILKKRKAKPRRRKNILNENRRKSSSSSSLVLPDELVLEILTWLPGKQLGRCKCVCKSWRSIIGSPPFLDAYRSRQRGLVLYVAQEVDPRTRNDRKNIQIRFFYSTLWKWLLKEHNEEFSCLYELGTAAYNDEMTQVVNGLTCVCEGGRLWTLYNICTGQRMRLPNPVRYNPRTISKFYLGYDPGSRVYKLLRLMIGDDRLHHQEFDHPLEAEIMTLRPSTSLSLWRKLDYNAACIDDLPVRSSSIIHRAKTFTGDGVLYWFGWPRSLFSFDLNKEKFGRIKLPEDDMYPHARGVWNLAQSMGRLALWLAPRVVEHFTPHFFILFVLEDDEGNSWSKHSIQLPKELDGGQPSYAIAKGKLPTGEMLMMNPVAGNEDRSMPVYSYDHYTNKFDRLLIGKLPVTRGGGNMPYLGGLYNSPFLDVGGTRGFYRSFHETVSCLLDNNNLYLPLDDVLSGGGVLS